MLLLHRYNNDPLQTAVMKGYLPIVRVGSYLENQVLVWLVRFLFDIPHNSYSHMEMVT